MKEVEDMNRNSGQGSIQTPPWGLPEGFRVVYDGDLVELFCGEELVGRFSQGGTAEEIRKEANRYLAEKI